MCRAVKSWLRSSSQYGVAEQFFVINRGLLQHIVHVLIERETVAEPSMAVGDPGPMLRNQSSFDLLGEMIMFNMEACRQLDILLSTEVKVK